MAESFFSSLKRELVHRYRFTTRARTRRAIFIRINRHNSKRLHSSNLNYLTPTRWEHHYHQEQANTAA